MCRILNIMTALFRWIGKLYSPLRTQVHLLFMPKALVCKLVIAPLKLYTLPHRIAFAQKRVVYRRSHNRKGALFPKYPDNLGGTIREQAGSVSGCNASQRGLLKDNP